MGCLIGGAVLSLAVFALLGQSRAAAMASVTIAVNAILATRWLGEPFTRIDLATTLLIATGTLISVIFGSAAGGPYLVTVGDVVAGISNATCYIAFGCAMGLIAVLMAVLRVVQWKGMRSNFEHKVDCFARAVLAGIFSASTGFLTKAAVVCITNIFHNSDWSDFKRFELYLFIIFLPISLFCQLYSLNSGLKRHDAISIIPIYQSSIVSFGVASGWIFYGEAEGVAASDMAMFAVGCGISVSGISLLFFKPHRSAYKPLGNDSEDTASVPMLSAKSPASSVNPTTSLLANGKGNCLACLHRHWQNYNVIGCADYGGYGALAGSSPAPLPAPSDASAVAADDNPVAAAPHHLLRVAGTSRSGSASVDNNENVHRVEGQGYAQTQATSPTSPEQHMRKLSTVGTAIFDALDVALRPTSARGRGGSSEAQTVTESTVPATSSDIG